MGRQIGIPAFWLAITPSGSQGDGITADLDTIQTRQERGIRQRGTGKARVHFTNPIEADYNKDRNENREGYSTAEDTTITVHELKCRIRPGDGPTVLVAFEFTGALRGALRRRGVNAISTDLRPTTAKGPHVVADVREIVPLQQWKAIFFVGPDCYQHLRADVECLPHKIADGRAFWGGAMVVWCLCCKWADMVLVEQPDTIANDYLEAEKMPGVKVYQVNTANYGDTPHKFLRLTTRNMILQPPPLPKARIVKEGNRSQFRFLTSEERDRARSSWASFTNLCDSLAAARPLHQGKRQITTYKVAIERFATNWHRAGHPVPADYANTDAQPSSESTRAYQTRRGAGDKRRPAITAPVAALLVGTGVDAKDSDKDG